MPGKTALLAALSAASIGKGGLLYFTGSVFGISEPDAAGQVLGAVIELLGPEGTLVVPTFSFAFCDSGLFDREHTPSFCGLLAERFRKWPGAIRTSTPPLHTVAALGAKAQEIAAIQGETSFGASSVFQWLADHDAKICLFGCTAADGLAHVHWLEEKYAVPYRTWRRFDGFVTVDGQTRAYQYDRFVRRPGVVLDTGPLLNAFLRSQYICRSTYGFTVIEAFSLSDFVHEAEPLFQANPSIMLAGPSGPMPGGAKG